MTSLPPTTPWNIADQREDIADPDAPLITWHWQQRLDRGQRRERSVTTDADLIGPSSVDRRKHDHVRSGQSYAASFAVLALPRHLHPDTMSKLMRMPGVHTAIVNNPVSRSSAKERLSELARQMGVSLYQSGEENADEELALRDLRRHLNALAEERSAHHFFGVYLTVFGEDLKQLHERCRDVLDACTDAQIAIRRCDYQHWDGILTTAPLGVDRLRYLSETDTPTLARLLPSSPNSLQTRKGSPILYGVRAEGITHNTNMGVPVILDRFTLPSPHQAVIAATGGGKTYQQFFTLMQRYAHGDCSICIIDPKGQEYRTFIEHTLGGTYLVLSERSSARLNPLMLPHGDANAAGKLRRLDMDVRASRAALVKQIVAAEALARSMPLTGRAEAQLEEAIFSCYEDRGITSDPATFHPDAPTLSDVLHRLIERRADPDLIEHMELFTTGTLGRLINAPGNLPLAVPPSRHRSDVGVLGVDLSGFVQGNDETLKRVFPVLIANYFITVAMNNTDRPMELVIDEAWSLLGTEAGSRVLEVIARIGRSLRVAATVITQQVREFLYRRVGDMHAPNESGKTFLDNCETILLLRQLRPARAGVTNEDNPVAMAARHFGLSPGEMTWLSQCRRDDYGATGLLIVGREPIPLRIPRAPEPLHSEIMRATGQPATTEAPAAV